jgi:quinoprotein relay system zinc metallohydrolase 2
MTARLHTRRAFATRRLRRPALRWLGLCAAPVAMFAAALAALPTARVANAADAEPLAVSQVAAGVFVHTGVLEEWQPSNAGDVANLGFVVGSRCVAVIDTGGTPQVGQRLLAAVRRATALPVCYVINTHAHPDHVLGNVAFTGLAGEPVRFVGAARLSAALAARERHTLNTLQRDFGLSLSREAIVHPTLLVDKQLDIDLGGRLLQLNTWPTAHTDHDLTVYDRQSRTLFLSDLLFVSHLPVLDGRLRGWLGVMESLKGMDVALAVPGHGAASADWPAVMEPQWNYLNGLLIQTKAAIKAKITIMKAVDAIAAPPGSAWRLTELFHRRNVTAAYAELEWED